MSKSPRKMGFNEPPLRRKYGNVPITANVNGQIISFDSKGEYRWAQYLDFLKTVGEIKDWFYEFHTFYFDGEGKPSEYTPDFLVRNNDNSFGYHEFKGMLQKFDIDKFKRMFDERPKVKITLIFWRKPKISVSKRTKLERYLHRIIWDAREMVEDKIFDMT